MILKIVEINEYEVLGGYVLGIKIFTIGYIYFICLGVDIGFRNWKVVL